MDNKIKKIVDNPINLFNNFKLKNVSSQEKRKKKIEVFFLDTL